jgi:hypothetical protein
MLGYEQAPQIVGALLRLVMMQMDRPIQNWMDSIIQETLTRLSMD